MEPCTSIFTIMQDFDKPWAIAGGWSIDLFLGKTTRKHDDIEIIVFRNGQKNIQEYLSGWSFMKVVKGNLETWKKDERLYLPIHETYAERLNEKIEILLNESEGKNWIYRRDTRIHRELSKTILRTKSGIPYLSPEITLLFKSKGTRLKDEMDFENTYSELGFEQSEWLRDSLKVVYGEHPWIQKL
ncbi:nucleotidyltransferase domain-containing protein [Brevibacillus daliensis]|uniref:nucleotidyltransferase domain-containing protein n=1 Tax=Brevibacillus daliensis TaxID=2892995 RepID=UPI001E2A5300|nr:hypothetical protein [Brevibacillus daliensis]